MVDTIKMDGKEVKVYSKNASILIKETLDERVSALERACVYVSMF